MRTIRMKEMSPVSCTFSIKGIAYFESDEFGEITEAEVALVKGVKGIEYFFYYFVDGVQISHDSKISFRNPWPTNPKEATALAIKYAKEVLDF